MTDYTLYLLASGPRLSAVVDEVVRLTELSQSDAEPIVSNRGVVASGVSGEEAEAMLDALRSAGAVVMRLPEAVCDVPDGLPLRLRVVDATGEPLTGAQVAVRTPDDGFNEAVRPVTTGEDGRADVEEFTTLIDEHFDERSGLPPVWFEVTRSGESFALSDSEFTSWEAFRDGEVRTYRIQVQRVSEESSKPDKPKESTEPEKQPESETPSEPSDEEYVIEGRVEQKNGEAAAGYTVVAYDRDLTQAQRLEEASTDQKGRYRIVYDASDFREDEYGSADLQLRVFTASGRELSVDVTKPSVPTVRGEQILFGAGPKETVHLRFEEPVSPKTAKPSRYEKALDRISQAAGDTPIHVLSADDQVFLHHDTGVPLSDVAFVVEDARLRRTMEMPEGVFFGLGLRGIGVVSEEGDDPPALDLALVREHAVEEIMNEVEAVLEEHAIPATIEEQLNEVRSQFETLRKKGPSQSRATRRRHVREIGALSGVDNETAQVISRHIPSGDATEETWTQLVDDGVLTDEQLPSLKRAFEVDAITQNHLPLTRAVLEGGVPQIDGSIESTRELARLDDSDWKTVMQENDIAPPEGYDADTYAGAVTAQVEVRHPTIFLAHRTTRRDRTDLSERIRRVQANAPIDDGLFTELAGTGPADVGDLDADTDLDVVDDIRDLTTFARTFRQLEVPRVLDDPALTVDEKVEEIDRRVQAVDTVFENNVGTDFLCVDALNLPQRVPSIEVSTESSGDGAPAASASDGEATPEVEIDTGPTLSYDGVPEDLRPLVRRQMQTYQRTLALTGRADEAVSLLREGYDSAHSVADTNRSVFTEQVDLPTERAEGVYDEATIHAERARYRLGSVLGEALRHRMPLPSDNTDDRIVNTLRELDGFEKILGNRVGCDCEHCRSIFGPLAYFVDLMRFVEQHVIEKYFDDLDDHPLDPRTRRPDLWDEVSLTCDNATEMVPYLQIVVEVLSAFIARDEGLDTSGLDRAGLVQKVFDALREGDRSFDQPFNLPYEEMLLGLDRLDLDAAAVTATAGASDDVTARARLGLSPEDVETVTTSIANDTAELQHRYGIPSGDTLDTIDVHGLMETTSLDRDAIGRLVELDFVDGPATSGQGIHIETVMGDAGLQPEAQKLKGLTAERLDRLFRLVRLQRALPWPLEAVNHALYAITRASGASEATIDKRTIRDLAAMRQLQVKLDASPAQIFALVDRIPTDPVEPDADSFFDQLFNTEAFVDENGAFDPSTPVDFWHPPYDDGPAPGEARDSNLPRLLQALDVSEETFNALMEILKGRFTINTRTLSGGSTRHYVELSLDTLSTLYRHAFVLSRLNLSVSELDAALQMVQSARATQDTLPLGAWPHGSNSADEPVLQSLLDLVSWIRDADLSILDAASIALDSPPARSEPIRTFSASTAPDLASEAESRVTFHNADIYERVDLSESTLDAVLTALEDTGYLTRSSASDPWRLTESYDASTFPSGLNLDADVQSELTGAKKAALRRALNRYLPETHVTEVLAETLDVTIGRLRRLVRTATGQTPSSSEQALTRKQGLMLSSTSTSMSDLLDHLKPLDDIYLSADRLGLSDAALSVVAEHPSVFTLSPGDRDLVTREPLRRLARYRQLRQETASSEALDALLTDASLDADYASLSSGEQNTLAERLAAVADAGQELAGSVLGAILTGTPRPDRVADLVDAVDLAGSLETTGTGLSLFRAEVYDRIKQARDVVYSALYARYEEGEPREAALEPLREHIRERQRDVLVNHLTAQPALRLDTPKNIYYYFLLDPEMSGCARTSRVVAATGSLQLYVNRCLMNLEQEAEGKAAVEGNHIHVKPADIPDDEWEWRKKYRVWEANRKVFLYPENYLEPGLRSDSTEPFGTLEDRLLQEDVDDATARNLFREYLDAFSEVANLRVAGHYFEPAPPRGGGPTYEQRAGTLYLVGRTPSNPRQFYLRARTLEAKENNSDYIETWSNWSRIEMDIQADEVSPVVFRNRLYLFWVESTTKPWYEGSGENRTFNGYRHSIKLKFIHRTAKGRWTPPQKLDLPADLRIINDELGPYEPTRDRASRYEDPSIERIVPRLERSNEPPHVEARDDYTLDHRLYNRIFPFVQDDTLYFQYGVEGNVYSVDIREREVSSPDDDPVLSSDPTGTLRTDMRELYYRRPSYRNGDPVALYFGRNREWGDYVSYYYEAERARLSELKLEYHESGGYFTLKGNDSTPMDKAGEVLPDTRIQAVNNAPHLFVLEQSEGAMLLERTEKMRMKAMRLRTAMAEALQETLFENGLWEMLSVDTQQQLREPDLIDGAGRIGIIATGSTQVSLKRDASHSFLTYLWEVFFHAPLLIAHTLNGRGRFEAAERWYNVVFDPAGEEVYERRKDGRRSKGQIYNPADRNWRFTGFHRTDEPALAEMLKDDSEAFQAYLEDPFDPFAVADARPLAYQRYVLMAYVDNLLDWGDDLFAQDTRESISEATLLYITAADVLGRRPVSLGECPQQGSGATYDNLDTEETFLVTAENLVQSADTASGSTCRRFVRPPTGVGSWGDGVPSNGARSTGARNGVGRKRRPKGRRGSAGMSPPIFCVPRNEELLGYWDRVEDRLYKIRHCMNLQGVRRTLSLFEPPIEPDLLVRARAAGLTVDEVVGGAAPEAPHHRFRYLFSKAKEYVSLVRSFGNALQSALEKKDTEELQRMRALHAKNLEEMRTEIRKKQIEIAEVELDSLDEQKAVLEHRQSYYGDKKRTNAQEKAATVLTDVAMGLHTAASVLAAAAPPLKATPQGHAGISGLGPHATVEYGGEQAGGTVQAIAKALRDASTLSNMASSRMKTQARYERRKEDWDFQAESAEKQLTKLEKDRTAAEIRKQIAERELELHEKKKDQAAEVYDFYGDKLTDLDLYNWLASELKGLYQEAYRMALDVCKRAEKAFQFERDSERVFIEPGHWNGSKAGLLAGDQLRMQLQRMDKAFMDTARRNFEIEQTFSLGQLDPTQLERLRETGTAEFRLPEVAFDLAYPGQYRRRIRSVRLTIPCNAGPYVNVNAKLTQIASEVRDAPDASLESDHTGAESIATSQAKNDSGVFELRFDGEQYVPFEGTGAVSEWRLELPETVRSFDYDTISDVLVHVGYTAREDGRYREEVQNALRTKLNQLANNEDNTVHRAYRLREQFSSAFQGLFRQGTDPRTIEIMLDEKNFPHFLRGSRLEVQTAVVALALDDDWAEHYDSSAPLQLTVAAESDGTRREQSQPLLKQGGEKALQGLLLHATYFGDSGGATLNAGSTPLKVTLSVAESDLTSLFDTLKSEAGLSSDVTLRSRDVIDDLVLLLKVKVNPDS